ncbi:MAG: ammonium transporter [Gaiellales bacterium]
MQVFKEQLSLDTYFLDFLYTFAAFCVILVVLALGLIDSGIVRKKNLLDTWVVKIACAMVAGLSTIFVGYAIWQWSFNQAFGLPNPLSQALKDWWLGGTFVTQVSSGIDPKILPEADVNQIFLVFFMTFSMATMALVHSSAVERVKGVPLIIMSAVVGLVLSPLAGYLCWGPVSPLTNRGVHDFDGLYPLYIFSGFFSLVLAWRLGPRKGLGPDGQPPKNERPLGNMGMIGAGMVLIMFALPFIALGSSWFVPGEGVFGISMTSTGFGLIVTNVITSFLGAGLVGVIIAYRQRNPIWILLGPISGAVLCGALFDITKPWVILIVSLFGPIVTIIGQKVMQKTGIDESKVVPLALFNGIVGVMLAGFIGWGTKTGGYFGLEGEFGFQHAEINPLWQLVGIVAIFLVSAVPAFIMCVILEKVTGLRVSDSEETHGTDEVEWGGGAVQSPATSGD